MLTCAVSMWASTSSAETIEGVGLSGSGTSDDPYLIEGRADWNNLSSVMNTYKLTGEGYYFKLTDDITLISFELYPIDLFSGELDGNNITVSRMAPDTDDFDFYNYSFGGLVKQLGTKGYIHDITLKGDINLDHDVYDASSLSASNYLAYLGGVVGKSYGKIENVTCSLAFDISTLTGTRACTFLGGIAGYVGSGSIVNCTYSADISLSDLYCQAVGGIVGHLDGGTVTGCSYAETIKNTISSSSFTSVSGAEYVSGHNTGGLVGYMSGGTLGGTDDDDVCSFTGTLTGQDYTGGIVGNMAGGTIKGITITTDATITVNGSYGGGIVGYLNGGTITGCTNDLAISVTENCAGGIAGVMNTGTISDCTNAGAITTGEDYAGGIVGWVLHSGASSADEASSAVISGCTNTGAITGPVSSDDTATGLHIGGIAGRLNCATMTDCTNSGTITGYEYVGGLVGLARNYSTVSGTNEGSVTASLFVGGIAGECITSGTLSGCTNSGTVFAADTVMLKLGGIVGSLQSDATVSNCKNTAAISVYGSKAGGIVGELVGGTVTGCVNTANITSNGENNTDSEAQSIWCSYYIGGITGYMCDGGTVSDCTNSGSIFARTNNVGGIIGRAYGQNTISGCTNTGPVMGRVATHTNVGGILGSAVGDTSSSTDSSSDDDDGDDDDDDDTEASDSSSSDNYSGSATDETDIDSGKITISSCTNGLSGDTVGQIHSRGLYAGGIVGYSVYADISECYNYAAITSSNADVGGIAGTLDGSNTVSSCENYGAVYHNGATSGCSYAGGIVGQAISGDVIKDCTNFGAISGRYSYLGGIIGALHYGEMSGCTNEGSVKDTRTSSDSESSSFASGMYAWNSYVGGVAGYARYSTIKDCTNLGSARAQNPRLGGVLGYAGYCTVSGCINGSEDSDSNTASIEVNHYTAGGIIGYATGGSVSECINYMDFTTPSYDAGGILGGFVSSSAVTISDCKNYGNITSTYVDSEYSYYSAYVGGILGHVYTYDNDYTNSVSGCYNYGNITATSPTAGGIVGCTSKTSYTNCYNYGDVTTDKQFAGGIFAYSSGSGSASGCENWGAITTTTGDQYVTIDGQTTTTGNDSGTYYYSRAGGIGGFATEGDNIDSCKNYGTITGGTKTAGRVGGIVAQIYGSSANLTTETDSETGETTTTYTTSVTNCYNYGYIRTYGIYTGGICGILSTAKMDNCHNGSCTDDDGNEYTGKLYFQYDTSSGIDLVMGGVVGQAQTTALVSNCTNSSEVYSTDGQYVGGVAGGLTSGSTLSNCTNSGTVTCGLSNDSVYVGGIVGSASGRALTTLITVDGCKNTGTLSCSAGILFGGIAGKVSYGTISNCENTAALSGESTYVGGIAGYSRLFATISDSKNASTGSVSGTTYIGGIVGYATESSGITDCSNFATVKSTYYEDDETDVTTYNYVGGIAGKVDLGTYSGCRNYGEVYGLSRIGGVFGFIYGSSSSLAEVSGCYNYGPVNGTGQHVGGIAGLVSYGNISGCYNSYIGNTLLSDEVTVEEGDVTSSGYGTVTSTYATPTTYSTSEVGTRIGGLVGQLQFSSALSDCGNYCSVTNDEGQQVGGIVGRLTSSTLDGCTNAASITATATPTVDSGSSLGGIAGYCSSSTISNCQNTADGIMTGYSFTGGIVGCLVNWVTIESCVNYAAISTKSSRAGGIVGGGYVEGGGYNTMSGCVNHGAITSDILYAGGIAGTYAGGSNSTSQCYNTGAITAKKYAGGIVGFSSSTGDAISECFNVGTIEATGELPEDEDDTSTYYGCAGGIGGVAYGSISNCYNASNVSGAAYVGGIVGGNAGYTQTVSSSYFSGNVFGEESVGAIVGHDMADGEYASKITLTDVYYITYNAPEDGVTNTVSFTGDSGDTPALTYDELASLDLGSTYWTSMDDYSYPMLVNLCENDYAQAYSAAVVPYVTSSIAKDRDLDAADWYGCITDYCYLGGRGSEVTWTSDDLLSITNWQYLYNKYGSYTDHTDEWETTGYVAINDYSSYWRADFNLVDGVKVSVTAQSARYDGLANTTPTSTTDVSAAAAVRSDDEETTEADDTEEETITPVTATTYLVLSTYSGNTDDSENGFTSGILSLLQDGDDGSNAECELIDEEYYTVSGARVSKPQSGQAKSIYIVVRKYSDGTIATAKEAR